MIPNNTQDTQTQLLVYIASMVLRIQSQQRHLQMRLQILELSDSPTLEFAKKCFNLENAHRLTHLELEGFGEQFPELARFAQEYSELSDACFSRGLGEAALKAYQSGPSTGEATGG